MRTITSIVRLAGVGVAFLGGAATHADTREEIEALREHIRQLDQKLQALEQQQAAQVQAAAAATKSAPKLGVSGKGVTLVSDDGANSLRLRGLVQLDSRDYFGGTGVGGDSFVLRRARFFAEGRFAKIFTFQVVPEFAGSSPSLLDANLGLDLGRGLQVKAGKFKVPIGLELLQSDSWTFFDERALPTNLLPNRDLGVQLSGGLADGVVGYTVGIFNGVADGASSTNSDTDSNKDFVARLVATPFKAAADSPLRHFSVGVAGSVGLQKPASGLTSGYKTDGQQTVFKYKSVTVADGADWRFSPQLEFRRGPFGLIGEYVLSAVTVRPPGALVPTNLTNRAWQVAAGYVLTGEDSSYDGVVPRNDFDPTNGTWGAFEIAGRCGGLTIDSAAFAAAADPTTNAHGVNSIGVGLNWYLSRVVRATFDYYRTHFDSAAGPSTPRLLLSAEQAMITRLQLAF